MAKHAARRAREAFEGGGDPAGLGGFRFESQVWRRHRSELFELTERKCAFCESSGVGGLEIEHFRPLLAARGATGDTDGHHYYWLAYEWRNVFPICPACNRAKHDRFPVPGERAPVGTPFSKLGIEEAFLIDPCLDRPERLLAFLDDGHVADLRPPGPPTAEIRRSAERAMATIETFGLNRTALVAARRDAIREAHGAVDLHLSADDPAGESPLLQEALRPGIPYAMARRQAALRRLAEKGPKSKVQVLARIAGVDLVAARAILDSAGDGQSQQRLKVRERRFQQASFESDRTFARSAHIDWVRVENFRGIGRLEVDLADTEWTMLLGENGAGKSSVLQAIALGLLGKRATNHLKRSYGLSNGDFVRNRRNEARITIKRLADAEPLRVVIPRRGEISYETSEQQQVVVLGFGSSRWPSRPGSLAADNDEFTRVANLFNPFVPLTDVERWLMEQTRSRARFRTITAALHRLLDLDEEDRFVRGVERISIRSASGGTRYLNQLSDGYQTVLAMAVAMMDPLLAKFDDLQTAEGVVLIDEIDAHLHPRWKLRVVDDLRNAFPGLQFVATTHDPLCLRGVRVGEIRRMEVEEGRTIIRSHVPDPTKLSVEELLTSSVFGLLSTQSSESEALFDEYYDLLGRTTGLTPEELDRRTVLRTSIGRDGVLGRSPRDQRIYAIADEWLAYQRAHEVRDLTAREVRNVASQLVNATNGLDTARRVRIRSALAAAFGDLDDSVGP